MNTPISWIKAYVPDLDCTVQEYVDKMTLSGSHVENAVYLDKNLEKIVVGRIEKIERGTDKEGSRALPRLRLRRYRRGSVCRLRYLHDQVQVRRDTS